MNFPQNKSSITYHIYNILEDLKKQIFSIQYYSILQKMFISQILKFIINTNNDPKSNNNDKNAINHANIASLTNVIYYFLLITCVRRNFI